MPEDANPFTPIASNAPDPESGEPSTTSHEIAAAAAAAAVREIPIAPPGEEFKELVPAVQEPLVQDLIQQEPLPTDQYMEPGTTTPAAEPVPAPAEPTVAPVVEPGTQLTFTPEDYEHLQSLGVDLPVRPEDVAPEFQDKYAQMAQAFLDIHHSTQQIQLDAQEAIISVQDIKDGFTTPEGQERLLMGVAMNNPESFTKVVEVVERMAEDSQYADSIRRGLEAEVKYEAAIRKERAFEKNQLRAKGNQIEQRTNNLAKRLGLDETKARRLVADRIVQNQTMYGRADISFEEVDLIIQGAAHKLPAKVASPTTQQQITQVPQTPAASAAQTPAPQVMEPAPKTPMGDTDHFGDKLRMAVKTSAHAVRNTGL